MNSLDLFDRYVYDVVPADYGFSFCIEDYPPAIRNYLRKWVSSYVREREEVQVVDNILEGMQ